MIGAVDSFAKRNGIALVIQFSADKIDPANPQSIMRGVNRAVVYQHQLNITDFVIEIVNAGTPKPVQGGAVNTTGRPQVPGRRLE